MKIFNRVDLVPDFCEKYVVYDLMARAKKCGLKVRGVLDIQLDGEHYKELLLQGTRWGYFKYWGIALLKREAQRDAIPGVIKLMFM